MADIPAITPNLLPAAPVLDQLGKSHPTSVAQAEKLAGDFAAEFMSNMLRPMFDSAGDNWFGGGEGEDVYKTIMVREFGTVLAKSSAGVGIADKVKKELLHLQEVQQASTQQTAQAVKGANQGQI